MTPPMSQRRKSIVAARDPGEHCHAARVLGPPMPVIGVRMPVIFAQVRHTQPSARWVGRKFGRFVSSCGTLAVGLAGMFA